MQIPLGHLLDKHGPKKIVSSFLLIAIIGTIAFALAQNFAGLLLSRILIGVGVSACLMGPLTAYRIWFADEYQQRANAWMLMVLSMGFVFSTLPVQILLPVIGWRWVFGLIAILIFLVILMTIFFIPKWKNNETNEELNNNSSLSIVWKNQFFLSTIPLGLFNYGGMVAIQTLWAGPWMVRVSGYNPMESATGLFWINITMLIAFFIFGYILPKVTKLGFETMKIMKIGLPISYLSLLMIIFLGNNAGALFFTIYLLTSIVLTLTQPAVALAFPTKIAGTSLTSFNLLIFVGTFIMQWSIGVAIDISKYLGFSETKSFQIAFSLYLIICVISYLYFLYKNNK